MSSWKELYDDYKDATLNYVENVVITPIDFMRKITRAQQKFQIDTRLVWRAATLQRAVDSLGNPLPWFNLPAEFLEHIEIRDNCGHTLLSQGYDQFRRNQETYRHHFTNTPDTYSIRLDSKPVRIDASPMPEQTHHGNARTFTIAENNKVLIHPLHPTDMEIDILYYPDLVAFSEVEPNWSLWFPIEINFDAMFNTTQMNNEVRKFEQGILNYAIAEVVKRSGSDNYKIFEKAYNDCVQECIALMPKLNRESQRDYYYAPFM